MMTMQEDLILLDKGKTAVYIRRFWVLGLYLYISFVNTLVLEAFTSIAISAKYALEVTEKNIALLNVFAEFSTVVFMIPLTWLTQTYGLRVGLLVVSTITVVSGGLRCIMVDVTIFTYVVYLTSLLNGVGFALSLSLPAMVSATWFPVQERSTATAVGAMATRLGLVVTYFAPLIVRQPSNALSKDDIKQDIYLYFRIIFWMAVLGFICVVAYFPKKPPKPPSVSSSVERIDYLKSLGLIARNVDLIIVLFTHAVSRSLSYVWITALNFRMQCLGISQNQTGWIGLTSFTVGLLLAFVVVRLADRFHRNLKTATIVLFFVASGFLLWLSLLEEKIVPVSFDMIFAAVVCGISFQYATVPLQIELAMELAYPCPESAVSGIMCGTKGICCVLFYLLLTIPSSCFQWTTFALLGSCSLTIIPMALIKPEYKRSNLDLENSGTQKTITDK